MIIDHKSVEKGEVVRIGRLEPPADPCFQAVARALPLFADSPSFLLSIYLGLAL